VEGRASLTRKKCGDYFIWALTIKLLAVYKMHGRELKEEFY
jgi:hypothetical protein